MSTNNQTCNKCHENKPLNQFHRKGAGYQRTCKQCRNVEVKKYTDLRSSGKLIRRKTSPIQKENFIALQERIAALEPRLRAKAAAFANDNLDADDIYSTMVVNILTKSKPDNDDLFILQRASWSAKQYVSKNVTYSQYVENIDIDEKEAKQAGFKIVTNPREIEDAMIHNEDMVALRAVIETMPIENQKIVAMLSIGMTEYKIAAELQMPRKAIAEKMQSIRTTLQFSFA